jgi:ubiquitin-like modifier-activating enzyme 5
MILLQKCAIFRYLLHFGTVSHYLGYNAMDDFFPKMSMKPNTECDDYHCKEQQKLFAVREAERVKNLPDVVEVEVVEEVMHEDNDWGISLVGDDQPDQAGSQPVNTTKLSDGLSFAYERSVTVEAKDETSPAAEAEQSLEDLMKQMKQL